MEDWKDIPGYKSLYQASTEGRIRTCEGKITKNARFENRVWKQRILKPKYGKRKSGKYRDARVSLWKDGKESTYLISRLVALTWCDGYQEGMTVNHKDGNPDNNHCENLEWISRAENIRHGFRTGLYPTKRTTLVAPDGTEIQFVSMAAASRFLRKRNGYIWDILRKGNLFTPEGYRIEVAS